MLALTDQAASIVTAIVTNQAEEETAVCLHDAQASGFFLGLVGDDRGHDRCFLVGQCEHDGSPSG